MRWPSVVNKFWLSYIKNTCFARILLFINSNGQSKKQKSLHNINWRKLIYPVWLQLTSEYLVYGNILTRTGGGGVLSKLKKKGFGIHNYLYLLCVMSTIAILYTHTKYQNSVLVCFVCSSPSLPLSLSHSPSVFLSPPSVAFSLSASPPPLSYVCRGVHKCSTVT